MPPLASDLSLRPFFSPRGVAVVGASHDPAKLGYGLARNLIQSGFPGAIHFVNPKGGTLLNKPLYTNLMAVPDPVDLAFLLIPAQAVPAAIQECGQRGIRAVVIGSGGFREVGPGGAALEQECLRVAGLHAIRLLGPNCIGLLDTHFPYDATFLPPPGPTPGDVAFISHSGAICAVVIDWARGQGFGLSLLVSLGNQVDVNETDVLQPVAADPHTRVMTLYLEGVSDGRRFVSEARQVTSQKPVIALKVGRFNSGRQAVASHTGALAGEESAFNAAFRRAGVIRADTSEELFDWARALAWCPLPAGRQVAVLTNAGGPGVTAADNLESHGLCLAKLQDETLAALRAQLGPAASTRNPVDMLATASPEQYAACLRILLADPGVHSVMVILPPPPMHTAGGVAKAIIPIIYMSEKPVVIALMGERLIQEAIEHFRAARVPDYRFPERAAAALATLVERAEFLSRSRREPKTPAIDQDPGIKPEVVKKLLETYVKPKGDNFLPQEVVQQILQAYGIPFQAGVVVKEPQQASNQASKMGFPVALKVVSPDILHKTDAGGVLLGLENQKSVVEGFHLVIENARRAFPGAEIQGVQVQRMITGGQEVIVGSIQDQQFGPLVMFGSGGVEVEGLKDVEFALAPLTNDDVEYLLEHTWAGRRLRGYRHLPPADRDAVKDILCRLSRLAVDFPQLAEIEINPLLVMASNAGAYALDVRIRCRQD